MKDKDTLLSGDNLPFIEALYNEYLEDPDSVDPSWKPLFEEYFGTDGRRSNGGSRPSFEPRGLFSPATRVAEHFSEAEYAEVQSGEIVKTPGKSTKFAARVQALVRAHRLHGHLIASIDPLGEPRHNDPPELDPQRYDIVPEDMETPMMCEALFGGEQVTLRRVIERMRSLYCGTIGVEFQHIPDSEPRSWVRHQIERNDYAPIAGGEERRQILEELTDADAFEEFLDKKYVGAKRFSLSGGISLIPMMKALLNEAGSLGIEESILGMAHRGRLNVLHNIMGKPAHAMLSEFEKTPNPEEYLGSSDVKYHMGYSSDFETPSGNEIHLSLTFNPSHLEFVNPVVMGRTRAKQDRCGRSECRSLILPLLLHGDAAFSGQGIVAETLNLANLEANNVGGTIHVVINNQIGFTATPVQTRSTTYATDIARILEVPIFHVNGQDPEACVRVAKLAMRYRQQFNQDVVIDLVCYRKYGHNEGDEPRFTQPLMYRKVEETTPVREAYADQLIDRGVVEEEEVESLWDERMEEYAGVFEEIHESPRPAQISTLDGVWNDYEGGNVAYENGIDTSVPKERLAELGTKLAEIPDDVEAHRTIKRLFKQRGKMVDGEVPIDWGFGEALAFASLVTDGTRVRLCGQDSIRGTFSHRHAAITDNETGELYWPTCHLSDDQAPFEVYNSMLSEAGVLGFEYGFSLDYPDALVAWEAQFGDFANGAQVIIDQFISSGEDKWKRLSGLVLLLPHGYEGQGPEHSSARLERFLQLSAEDNWFVCNFTTPAQYFHALRRQVLDPVRKPLIVMTPKSLLRHREAVSTLDDLSDGSFQHVIDDPREEVTPENASRVILCSGKVYYDLLAYARDEGHDETALIRVEQLHPLATSDLKEVVERYADAETLLWVQEEPKNMGAWNYIFPYLVELFGAERLPRYVGRVASASPATGSKESHDLEQTALIREAFSD